MIYSCCNEERRAAVLGNPAVNGVDYLEVLDSAAPPSVPRQQTLFVHCLNSIASINFGPPPGGPPTPVNVLIEGGETIKPIAVDWVIKASAIAAASQPDVLALLPLVAMLTDSDKVLVVRTHTAGDFSNYRLRLVNDAAQATENPFEVTDAMDGFDPLLADVEFSFKVECGPDFDCAPQAPDCTPPSLTPPPINYLAKDYGSFRTVILDRLRQLLPGWTGGATEADLGVVLAELLAYVGDNLSYQQDAIATEAYLETARRRVSLRRHALLIDYTVRDGCNARAWIQINVNGNAGDAAFLDRSVTRFYAPLPRMLLPLTGNERAALQNGVPVFEPMHDAVLYPEHNQFTFYTWGDANCCLPAGATEASLTGSFAHLEIGDVLIFEEIKGPLTGAAADADLRHRCAVRLTQVAVLPHPDPLFKDKNGDPIEITQIQWSEADGLPFPLCISSSFIDANGDQQSLTDVSVAHGNVVLADHGLSFANQPLGAVPKPALFYPPNPTGRCDPPPPAPLPVRFRPILPDRPVTQAAPLAIVPLAGVGNPLTLAVALFKTNSLTLADSKGFPCLTLSATNSSGWPQNFGVVVAVNLGNPSNFDLSVIYNPPAGAAGIYAKVVLEIFSNLSLNAADPNFAPKRINAASQLIRVPASFTPPSGPLSGFPAAPTMLNNTSPVNLSDLSSPPLTYLAITPFSPLAWPALFGVRTEVNAQDAALFDLLVVYDPPSAAVGPLTLPITVEAFSGLSLADAAVQVNPGSALITVESFAQAPDLALTASALMTFAPEAALPSITLAGTDEDITTTWNPAFNLLESSESDATFVVEVEADGTAMLRFGDNLNGRNPASETSFTATYRIGNGSAGNVGAESLTRLDPPNARIASCRNPLAAAGGVDPETTEQIRRRAPAAFLTQERAVTMADYAAMTELNSQVERAAASLRWTGSWYTVFDAVEPKGGGNLTPALAKTLRQGLERYRLAGQDLELDSPQYVSLDIALHVCVDPAYFQNDVERALSNILSNKILPDGQKGVFYPDNFSFGQSVFLSPIYAAVRSVAGVNAVSAVAFQPQGIVTNQYLEAGEIKLGALQIARLDNDRNFPDHGRLTLLMQGGK